MPTVCRQPSRRYGFTLVEILVVIGVIAVLVAILLPVLGRARQQARRVKAASDMREMVAGYAQYHMVNRGWLLPGMLPDASGINGAGSTVTLRDGSQIDYPASARYPLRLNPYVSDIDAIIWSHYPPPQDRYTFSVFPGVALNSVFLGGHAAGHFKGFVKKSNIVNGQTVDVYVPNFGHHVYYKAAEVRYPAMQIVFTEVRSVSANLTAIAGTVTRSDPDDDGYCYVVPPRFDAAKPAFKRLWEPSADGLTCVSKSSQCVAMPNTRYGPKGGTVVGFFDGHVASLTARELDDMRLWTTKADRADWTIPNP